MHVIIPATIPISCFISTADAFAASVQVKFASDFDIVLLSEFMIIDKCGSLQVK